MRGNRIVRHERSVRIDRERIACERIFAGDRFRHGDFAGFDFRAFHNALDGGTRTAIVLPVVHLLDLAQMGDFVAKRPNFQGAQTFLVFPQVALLLLDFVQCDVGTVLRIGCRGGRQSVLFRVQDGNRSVKRADRSAERLRLAVIDRVVAFPVRILRLARLLLRPFQGPVLRKRLLRHGLSLFPQGPACVPGFRQKDKGRFQEREVRKAKTEKDDDDREEERQEKKKREESVVLSEHGPDKALDHEESKPTPRPVESFLSKRKRRGKSRSDGEQERTENGQGRKSDADARKPGKVAGKQETHTRQGRRDGEERRRKLSKDVENRFRKSLAENRTEPVPFAADKGHQRDQEKDAEDKEQNPGKTSKRPGIRLVVLFRPFRFFRNFLHSACNIVFFARRPGFFSMFFP